MDRSKPFTPFQPKRCTVLSCIVSKVYSTSPLRFLTCQVTTCRIYTKDSSSLRWTFNLMDYNEIFIKISFCNKTRKVSFVGPLRFVVIYDWRVYNWSLCGEISMLLHIQLYLLKFMNILYNYKVILWWKIQVRRDINFQIWKHVWLKDSYYIKH